MYSVRAASIFDCRFVARLLTLCVPLGLVMSTGQVVGQNLVLQWEFDEASGNALDTGAVGPAADGTLGTGAVRSADTPGGGPGFAIDLSAAGTDSVVDGGTPAKVDSLAQATLTSWLKMTGDNAVDQGGSNNIRLMSKQFANATFDTFSWNLNPPNVDPTPDDANTTSPDAFRMGIFVGGQTAFDFAQADADITGQRDQWTFVAVTYDGNSSADNVKFYWGDEDTGVMQLGSTLTADAGAFFPSGTSARFGVGFTDAAPTGDTSIIGLQDDVRVYDGILDLAALDTVRLDNLPDVTGLLGDFNGDDTVSIADYTVWRDNLGSSNPLSGNGDEAGASMGVVDAADYELWKSQFGQPLPGTGLATAAVPEPGTWALAALTLAAAVTSRSRRKGS